MSEIDNPVEPAEKRPYVINFFGATSFGPNLTRVREKLTKYLNIYDSANKFLSPSSAVGVWSHRPFNTVGAEYKTNAQKIIGESGGRDIVAHGSSAGGIEVIHQIEALLDAGLSDKKIHILLTNVPGIESHGLASVKNNGIMALGRFAYRWVDMMRQMHTLEQDITYPLPEAYYSRTDPKRDENRKKATNDRRVEVIEDTPNDRNTRREYFKKYIHKRIADSVQREAYLAQLDVIDAQIEDAITIVDDIKRESTLRKLKRQRSNLVKPYKEEYFRDGRSEPSLTNKFMQEYDEIRKGIFDKTTTMLWSIAITFGLVAGPNGILATVINGYKFELDRLNRLAKERNVELTLSFGFMENDLIVPPQDIQQILDHYQDLKDQGLPLIWAGFFENMAHMTIGQQSEMLIEMIKRIRE